MQRERITITVEADLLAAVDELIDHSQIRNRSHAIEHAIRIGISLNEITQAFFILGNTLPSAEVFDPLMQETKKLGITTFYIISEPGHFPESEQFAATVRQAQPEARIETLPGDFGTAGALLLRQKELRGPILLVDIDAITEIPDHLSVAYSYHHQRRVILTHILTSEDGTNFKTCGISFAEPEICQIVPAGVASLSEDVFPLLAKACKVSTYVCQN